MCESTSAVEGWPSRRSPLAKVVDSAKLTAQSAGRQIDYVHLPILPERDDAYFEPLLTSDADGFRALQTIVQEVLEAEMTEALQAEKSERTASRLGHRSGYYDRKLVTRVGLLELRVPQDCTGRFSTDPGLDPGAISAPRRRWLRRLSAHPSTRDRRRPFKMRSGEGVVQLMLRASDVAFGDGQGSSRLCDSLLPVDGEPGLSPNVHLKDR